MKLGVFLPSPKDLPAFETVIGRTVDSFLWYQAITEDFNFAGLSQLAAAGRTIQLAWEPRNPSGDSINQPDYQLSRITRGDHDNDIRRWAQQLRDFGYPVLFRPMGEMNGDWVSWGKNVNGNKPADYAPAWRHIHKIFVDEYATNVKFIWSPNQSNSAADAIDVFDTYYPGDACVDYIGIDGYNWGALYATDVWTSEWKSFVETFKHSYDTFTIRTSKPVIISETASTEVGGDKPHWIAEAFAKLSSRFPRIESITWFNVNKETDWRVESSAASLAAFRQAIGGRGTLRIIDVSEHQRNINWDAAAGQIDGAIARASGYGWDRADYQFIRNRDELRRIGKPRGWYYFAGLGDPVQQANKFADIVGPLQPGETVWLDWEADVMAEGEAWALVFLRQATRRFGVTCGIYMSASPASSGWEQTRAEGYPLWVAAYNSSNAFWPDDDANHWPYAIWQYSSAGSVAGINGPVDMNTVIAWPGGTVIPQPQPTSEGEDMEVSMDLIRYPYTDGIERWQAFVDSQGYREWAIYGMSRDDTKPLPGQVIVKNLDGSVAWVHDFTLTHALPYQAVEVPSGHLGRVQVDYAEAGRGDVPTRRSVKK